MASKQQESILINLIEATRGRLQTFADLFHKAIKNTSELDLVVANLYGHLNRIRTTLPIMNDGDASDFIYFLTRFQDDISGAIINDLDKDSQYLVQQLRDYENRIANYFLDFILRRLKEFSEKGFENIDDTLKAYLNNQLKIIEETIAKNNESSKQQTIQQVEIVNELREKSQRDADEINRLRAAMQNEIEDIRSRYKDDLANFEIMKQEEIFATTAQKQKQNTRWWLWGIVGSSLLVFGFTFYFIWSCWYDFKCINDNVTGNLSNYLGVIVYYELIKRAVLRLFVLSLAIALLKFCINNYNALMHNYTVNTHKANSLAAAFRIIASIQNENTRDTILNLAGKEIFMQQKTGYLSKEEMKLDIKLFEKISSIFNSAKHSDG
ncbi:MAG TPA: hypothetical protein VK796_00405 [Cytophaga sp.]|jgi:hypothetical protein|nr:hypothetical protein [Cytophaga sp.]